MATRGRFGARQRDPRRHAACSRPLPRRHSHRQSRATSLCARSTCCAAWIASPAKTLARRKSCSIIFKSRRPRSVATSTTSASRAPELVQEIKAGGRIALVSDAGTPAVSDPGGWLVREAIAAGVPVIPIPGANAAISALIASGLPAEEFEFLGFLPEKAGARRTRLEKLAAGAAGNGAHADLLRSAAPHSRHAGRSGKRLGSGAARGGGSRADQDPRGVCARHGG